MHYALDRTNLSPEGTIAIYQIDARASTFKVRAFATGLLSAFGHSPTIRIGEFSGTAEINPDNLESASLLLRIKAASLTVADDISDKDRGEIQRQMYGDVLEVDTYPEIIFECRKTTIPGSANGPLSVSLEGQLTLHGVTQAQLISARVNLMGATMRASGEFSVSQSAFGIKAVAAPGGTIRLKDELKATFDIVARKQA